MLEKHAQMIGEAEFLRAKGRSDEAIRLCNEVLNEKFDTPEAIFLIARTLLDSGKTGMAHAKSRMAAQLLIGIRTAPVLL